MIEEAREEFWDGIRTSPGAQCPVCDRWGKMYARPFNRGMARTLIWVYQHARRDYRHLSTVAPRHILNDNQVGKLVFWEMAEGQPNKDDPSKKRSGWWRITEKGAAFIEGRITANSHVIEFCQEIYGWRADQVNMSHVLGRPFHYTELMEDSPP